MQYLHITMYSDGKWSLKFCFFPVEITHQDYIAVSNPLTFNPLSQQSSANPVCANFATIDDLLPQTVIVEDVEFFIVNLTSTDSVNIIPELATATVFIIDNDGKYTHSL